MSKRHAEADAAEGDAGAGGAGGAAADGAAQQSTGKTGKYRKEKPWDVDGIDHWCAAAREALRWQKRYAAA